MTVRLATLAAAVCALVVSGPATAAPAVALTGGGDRSLVLFDTASPATFVGVPVTGIAASELLDSVDVRPATGELYGVAVNGGAAQGHLYKIDWGTGVATAVGAPFAFAGAAINSTSMDFNPVVDRVRLVNAAGANVRVDPTTGASAGIDTNIAPAATFLGDIAYDRNAPGGTATTLYAINTTTDVLSRIGGINGVPSPNGGVLAAVGALGVNPGGTGGFDIAPDGTAYMVNGILFGQVNLATGAFSLTNQMAINMWGLTILQPSTLAIDPTSATGGEANGAATIAVKRSGPATGTVSVNYATSPGTAIPDVDYAPAGDKEALDTFKKIVGLLPALGSFQT